MSHHSEIMLEPQMSIHFHQNYAFKFSVEAFGETHFLRYSISCLMVRQPSPLGVSLSHKLEPVFRSLSDMSITINLLGH